MMNASRFNPKIVRTERPFWTVEEIQKTLGLAPDLCKRIYRTLMAYSRLRSQEEYDLKWGDLDLEKKELTVAKGKGCKSRVVPMH